MCRRSVTQWVLIFFDLDDEDGDDGDGDEDINLDNPIEYSWQSCYIKFDCKVKSSTKRDIHFGRYFLKLTFCFEKTRVGFDKLIHKINWL